MGKKLFDQYRDTPDNACNRNRKESKCFDKMDKRLYTFDYVPIDRNSFINAPGPFLFIQI